MPFKRKPKTYNRVGHVVFPVYSKEYDNLATLRPQEAGILTVRLLVEDQTPAGVYAVNTRSPLPTPDDFLVGCDGMPTAEAHQYFQQGRKVVENILLGAIDWSGVRTTGPDSVEFFCCLRSDLDHDGEKVYAAIESRYTGCKIWLMTGLVRKVETVDSLMVEIEKLGHMIESVPKTFHASILCSKCGNVKPLISAKRIGWKKLGKRDWACPVCVGAN